MNRGLGLRIRGLTKSFPSNGNGKLYALRDLDLDVAAGEFLVVVGPNGSGKTTLLNTLAGDYGPDLGSIQIATPDGLADWSRLPRWERAKHLARVFQDPRRGTAAGMTVWENLRLATALNSLPSPLRFSSAAHPRQWFMDRLANLGLAEKIDSRIADLSHGQRQLLAVELAMLRQPSFLLLDEHTASLDQANARQCLEATIRLSRENSTTVIMVTHNLADALRCGDRLVVMREAQVHANLVGEAKRVLTMAALLELCGYTA